MTSELYDILELAKDLDLEYEDITDLYISYIEEISNHCHKLNEAFFRKDYVGLQSEIHNVKGVAANLLLKDVFAEADSFERLLKKGDLTVSKERVEGLLKLLINSQDKIIHSFAEVNVIL